MTPCDNCIENECEVNGYVCPLYKEYQESKEQKMNDDLISRSALKKYKFKTQIANGVELEDIEVVPLCAIDNAPTVSDRYDERYAQGYIDGQTGADYDERVRG